MQTTNIWHKFHLYGHKSRTISTLIILGLQFLYIQGYAQWTPVKRGRLYDQNISHELKRNKDRLTKPVTFGFHLAAVRSGLHTTLSESFKVSTPTNADDIQNVYATPTMGFAVGVYGKIRLSEFWDFRVAAQANFNEQQMEYVAFSGDKETKIAESAKLEVPLLFKYRSQLRGIQGMYLVAGIKPGVALSRRKDEEQSFSLTTTDLSLEYGLGWDIFFPFFKFAPELRFSHGLMNVLNNAEEEGNIYAFPLEKLTTHSVTLYFHFGS